jgi:membrane protease YdiL (CAAX protease family)
MDNTGNKQLKSLPVWLCIILFLIGISAMSGIVSLFVNILFGPRIFMGWMHMHVIPNIVNESVLLISVLTMAALLLHYGEDSKLSSLGFSGKGRFGDFCMGFVIAALIMGIGFYVLVKLHQINIESIHFYKMDMLFSFLLYVIVAFAEEIAVRGYILGRMLRSPMNKYLALVISALIFSLMHVFNSHISMLPLINIFLSGLLLGGTYIYTRNLWYPLSLHLFWNFLQGPILGFQVSGKENFLSLIKVSRPNNTALNGGSFGFEGSLICTILLIVFVVLTIWIMENKQHNIAVEQQETAD